ncbi:MULTISPECIES: TonB-dependent receptor [unclassified Sphingobium]|uniref:TonB-dependent receptor n=2 Tax=unclassified Sphingobium TaxID=2611147 RepID=UPI0022255DA3|nr:MULTISPECIES: TonB-dependent receptor [unclassified Sphingobium]MCW2413307.1 iron complex outermembrane receptor protein [Sphingobium sp. B8D3D]MCW2414395.1 iron complex outermembrane receptor protein [Sphingobium sp. B8D3A]
MKANRQVYAVRALLTLLSSTTCIVAMAPALAQQNPQQGEGLEEIIVTAQRREENLQKVAVAATALSGQGLVEKGVTRVDELQTVVPSLSVTDAGLTQNVNIRGIGLASGSPAVANGVATYVDGIFQPPIVTTSSFYDIATVEVLRGPQGTFVGSNSTGGAIFINTRNPNLAGVEGSIEGSIGNYDARSVEAVLNLPLSRTLAIRGAGKWRTRDSFYTDIGSAGSSAGRLDELSGRFGALWKPTESFQALFKLEAADKETGGYAYRPITGTAYAAYRTSDPRLIDYDTPTQNDEKAIQASLELRYELGSGITLRSLSGYQNKRIFNLYDSDATNAARYSLADSTRLAVSTQQQFVRERVWTQEFNIISPTDQDLSWIVGGYYQRNRIDVIIENRSNGFPTDILIDNDKATTGVFGQVTYKITPQLALDVGARYSHFSVTGGGSVSIGRGIPTFPPNGLQVADLSGDHKDGRMTGKVSLNWTPDENNLFYAFVARGYKPGGSNSLVSEFDPETVIDYEIGWKATMLGGAVRTQLGAFYYDYNAFQFDALDPATGQTAVTNLTDAKVKGIEAQVQARVSGFTFDAGVAFVDSELGDVTFVDTRAYARAFPGVTPAVQCPTGQASNPPTCIDYTPFLRTTGGGSNLYSPKWTYNLGARYDLWVGDVKITPSVSYAYVGPQWTYIGYSPISDRLPSRGLLGARLGVQKGDLLVEAYGTNLTDETYVSGQFGDNEFYGAPREYGVRVRYDF